MVVFRWRVRIFSWMNFFFLGKSFEDFCVHVPLGEGICFLGEGFCHYPREKKIFPHKYCRDWPYVVETLPWLPSAFDGWWFFPRWILPTAFGGWKLFPSVYFLRNFSLMKYRLNGRIFTPDSKYSCYRNQRVVLDLLNYMLFMEQSSSNSISEQNMCTFGVSLNEWRTV